MNDNLIKQLKIDLQNIKLPRAHTTAQFYIYMKCISAYYACIKELMISNETKTLEWCKNYIKSYIKEM